MIKGKNEFGNLVYIDLNLILKVLKTKHNFQITLKSHRLFYLTDIDKPELLLKFTGMPLRKKRFVGSFNHLGKLKYGSRKENNKKKQKYARIEETQAYHV